MKNYFVVFLLGLGISLQAQNSLVLDLGQDQELALNSFSHAEHIDLKSGSLSGDFSGLEEDGFIKVSAGALLISDSEGPVSFFSEEIDVTDVQSISFSVDLSGIGTLDTEGWVHDWVDVNYIVDGQKSTVLNTNAQHTFNGKVGNVNKINVEVTNAKTFQLEIKLRVTGEDEVYSINKIELEKTPIDTKQEVLNQELRLFPNPTSDYVFLKNPENYNLNQIEVFTLNGQSLGQFNYPVATQHLDAGQYFLRVADLKGQVFSKSFSVIK